MKSHTSYARFSILAFWVSASNKIEGGWFDLAGINSLTSKEKFPKEEAMAENWFIYLTYIKSI